MSCRLYGNLSLTAGCTDYPTYLDRDSGKCVETCPPGTFGVVTGSVHNVTSKHLRVCESSELSNSTVVLFK